MFELIPVTAVPAIFELIRGVTVGLMVGMRDWILMLGERIALWACTAEPSRPANGNAATASVNAARRILIRQLARSWTMRPRVQAVSSTRRPALRCSHREIDDLLVLQLAHQAGNFILAHRLVVVLLAEQASLLVGG